MWQHGILSIYCQYLNKNNKLASLFPTDLKWSEDFPRQDEFIKILLSQIGPSAQKLWANIHFRSNCVYFWSSVIVSLFWFHLNGLLPKVQLANVIFYFWACWHFKNFELPMPLADISYFTYYHHISFLNNGTNLQHHHDCTSISIQSNLLQISIHSPILDIHQTSAHLSILNHIPLQDNFWSLHQSEFFDSWRWERNHTWKLNTVMRPTQLFQSLFLTIKTNFFWAEWGHFTCVSLNLLIFKLFWPFVRQILLICESESIQIFDRFWGSATCFLIFKAKAF